MSDNHGKVWWTELNTRDLAGAKKYYGEICGWTFESMPMDDTEYLIAMLDGKPVAGIFDLALLPNLKGVPAHWLSYFAVDDIDAVAAATAAAGGEVIREPWDIPNTGRVAILQDPTGAVMGMMTPEAMP